MKTILLSLLVSLCTAKCYGQLKIKEILKANSVEVYARSYRITCGGPGMPGFDFIDHVKENVESGSDYYEYQVITTPDLVESIADEIFKIGERTDCAINSTSPFFSFLVVLKKDDAFLGSFWVETLNHDHFVYVDDCQSTLRRNDLTTLLSLIKHSGIRKPLKKWIRKAPKR